jgi:CheY-specific phosphatase CheX
MKQTMQEIIDYQVNGMIDAEVKKSTATKIVKQMIAELKKSFTDDEIIEYFTNLQNPATNNQAQKMLIHKSVDKICSKLAKERKND